MIRTINYISSLPMSNDWGTEPTFYPPVQLDWTAFLHLVMTTNWKYPNSRFLLSSASTFQQSINYGYLFRAVRSTHFYTFRVTFGICSMLPDRYELIFWVDWNIWEIHDSHLNHFDFTQNEKHLDTICSYIDMKCFQSNGRSKQWSIYHLKQTLTEYCHMSCN